MGLLFLRLAVELAGGRESEVAVPVSGVSESGPVPEAAGCCALVFDRATWFNLRALVAGRSRGNGMASARRAAWTSAVTMPKPKAAIAIGLKAFTIPLPNAFAVPESILYSRNEVE